MTNGDKLNEILRKYFPNDTFPKSFHHEIDTLKIHFSEEWLNTIYNADSDANLSTYVDTDSVQNKTLLHNVKSKRLVDFVLKNFPTDLQIDILQEECAELIKALSKYKREDYPNNTTNFKSNEETRKNVIEKMSHVLISIDVVSYILNIFVSEIQDEITIKCKKYLNNIYGANTESLY